MKKKREVENLAAREKKGIKERAKKECNSVAIVSYSISVCLSVPHFCFDQWNIDSSIAKHCKKSIKKKENERKKKWMILLVITCKTNHGYIIISNKNLQSISTELY